MSAKIHELAPHHLPYFIPLADGSDPMMRNVLIALIILVVLLGTFYLYLHSLPERLAHKHGRIQFELVAVLGLLALFTHNQVFWVAALVLAFIQLPDFMTPLETIASSARRMAFGTGEDPGEGSEGPNGKGPSHGPGATSSAVQSGKIAASAERPAAPASAELEGAASAAPDQGKTPLERKDS